MRPDTEKALEVLANKPYSQKKSTKTFIKIVMIITFICAIFSMALIGYIIYTKRYIDVISPTLNLFVFLTTMYTISQTSQLPYYYERRLQNTETFVADMTELKVPLDKADVLPEQIERFNQALLNGQLTIVPDSEDWSIILEKRQYRSQEVTKMLPKDKREFYAVSLQIPYPMHYIVDEALQPMDFDDLVRERKMY